MRSSYWRSGPLLIGLTTALVLGGCAGDSNTTGASNGPKGETAQSAAPGTEAPAPAADPGGAADPAGQTPAAAPSPTVPASNTPAPGQAGGAVASASGAASSASPAGSATAKGGSTGASPGSGNASGAKSPSPTGATPGAPIPGPAGGSNPGATDVGVTADEIKLGSISMYGIPAVGQLVVAMRDTQIKMAQIVNDTGGIYGRRIKYMDCDDGFADPTRFRACYKKLVEQEKIFAFWGGVTFQENDQVASINRDRIPFGAPASLYQVTWDSPWTFPVHMAMQNEARANANWVRDIRKPKTFGLLCLKTPEMQASCDVVKDVLTKAGSKLVHRVNTEAQTPDMSGDVLAMRAAAPDHIIHYTVNPASTARFMIDAAQQDYWPPKGMSGNHMAFSFVGDLIGDYPAKKGYWTNTTYKLWGPEYVAWMRKNVPQHGDNVNHVGQGEFWGSQVFLEALRMAGPDLTRDKVVAALNSREWDAGYGFGQKFVWSMAQRTRADTGNGREYM
jgi:hypothetical protein